MDEAGTWERVLGVRTRRSVLENAAELARKQLRELDGLRTELRKRTREAEAAVAEASRRSVVAAEELRMKRAHETASVSKRYRVLSAELESKKAQLKEATASLAGAESRAKTSALKL
eukprot:5804077-Pleurochrysis_carterae.AAC.1